MIIEPTQKFTLQEFIERHSWQDIIDHFTSPKVIGLIPMAKVGEYAYELAHLARYAPTNLCGQAHDHHVHMATGSAHKILEIIDVSEFAPSEK